MESGKSLDQLVTALGRESAMASRIKDLRVERGWSQAELAKQMASKGGCPIHQSAISKIEAPKPGEAHRSISIQEALAFAICFDVTLAELLLPPSALQEVAGMKALADGPSLEKELVGAESRVEAAAKRVAELVKADDAWRVRVAQDVEETAATVRKQGRELSDSIRWTFLQRVIRLTEER